MKCPNCETEMEKGFIDKGYWISGSLGVLAKIWPMGRKALKVIAWRCPKDSTISLATE